MSEAAAALEARIAELGALFQRLRKGESVEPSFDGPAGEEEIAHRVAMLWDSPERVGSRAEQRQWMLEVFGPPSETVASVISDWFADEGFLPGQPVTKDTWSIDPAAETGTDALSFISAGGRVLMVHTHFRGLE